MTTLSLRLPTSLHKHLKELAHRDGVSINQFISAAVGEKMAALMTATYLEERAHRGARNRYERVLAKVPDVEPDPSDRLPEGRPTRKRLANPARS
jgi:hypothetical protein